MHSPTLFVSLILLFAAGNTFAETTAPPNHSTVKILFVRPVPSVPIAHIGGGEEQLVVGGMAIPKDQFHPVSVSIDDEFVGNAIFGFGSTTPTFVLESGTYEFSFRCDGFKPLTKKLKVIGSGSTQYLLVRMHENAKQEETVGVDATLKEDAVPESAAAKR